MCPWILTLRLNKQKKKMIDVKNISVGDWVKVLDSKAQVRDIRECMRGNEAEHYIIQTTNGPILDDACEGIPITEEILKRLNCVRLEYENGESAEFRHPSWPAIYKHSYSEGWVVCDMIVDYVHELQHVLRLWAGRYDNIEIDL